MTNLSRARKYYKTILNRKDLFEDIAYQGDHASNNKRLTFMGETAGNSLSFRNSVFGRMTDINIWNRSFTDDEVLQWSKCEMTEVGNIVDWNNATWREVGLDEELIEKKEVCMTEEQPQLVVSKIKRNFELSVKF